jgi:pSer/pThr/pTyr-binding forkhead associated (FHA) protein
MPIYLAPIEKGRRIVLDKAIVFVGRHPECDVVLARSRKVSRKHCCIVQVDKNFIIRDLGSMNGIRVNGDRIPRESVLKPGDEVAIGDCRYIFTVAKESTSQAVKDEKAADLSQSMPIAIPEALVPDELDDSEDSGPIPLADDDPELASDEIELVEIDPDAELVDFGEENGNGTPTGRKKEYKDSGSHVELLPE